VVDAAVHVRAPAGREAVAPAVVRVLAVQVEARAEGVVPLRLPEAVEAAGHEAVVLRVEVALVPEEGVGLVRDEPRGTALLHLRAVEPEQRHHVARARLPVELRVPVLEERLVLRLVEADDADVVLPVRAPEPELVLDQGAADLRAPVPDLIGVVRIAALRERGSPASSSGRLCDCSSWLARKPRSEPWKALVPRLVTKLTPMPPDATLRSPPPVVTLISSKASKS